MENVMVVCRNCKVEKGVSEMKKDPRCKNGVQKICRDCENNRKKKNYELKKMFVNWKKDLEIEKQKVENEEIEQKKAMKREYDKRYREMKLQKKKNEVPC